MLRRGKQLKQVAVAPSNSAEPDQTPPSREASPQRVRPEESRALMGRPLDDTAHAPTNSELAVRLARLETGLARVLELLEAQPR